jgi:hypothetical protein
MPCGHPELCLFEKAHLLWRKGDFEGFMALYHDDILWVVNIDGIDVPYASSAVGKEDLRWRLQHMMDTFDIEGFDLESIQHGPEYCRSVVHLVYIHKTTREPLDVKIRFTGWEKDGVLVRFDERSDAAYVEAYNRFVHFLEAGKNLA